MKKYRICKNDYSYYKIQHWVSEFKILFFKFKGPWCDLDYTFERRSGVWNNRKDVEEYINGLIEKDFKMNQIKETNRRQNDESYKCDEKTSLEFDNVWIV